MIHKNECYAKIFDQVIHKGWVGYGVQQMAQDLGLTHSQFYAHFGSKDDVLLEFVKSIVDAVEVEFVPSATERDSLFDVMMMCFEKLAPYRLALLRIYNETVGHANHTLPFLMPIFMTSSRRLMKIATSEDSPFFVHFTAEKFLYVFAGGFKIWIHDEHADLSLTLIELDRQLNKVDAFQSFFEGIKGKLLGVLGR